MAKHLPEYSSWRRIFVPDSLDPDNAVPEVELAGWTQFDRAIPRGLMPHRHDGCFEVAFIKRGVTNWWVGNELYNLQPGQLFMTLPNELHGGQDGRMDACEFYWVIFSLDPRNGSLLLDARETAKIYTTLTESPYRVCQPKERTAEYFEDIMQAWHEPAPLQGAAIRASMTLLLREITVSFANTTPDADRRKKVSPRLEICLRWLEKNAHKHPTVEMMAAQAELRPSFFRELFRKETGFGPHEYMILLLMRDAKERLTNSDSNITDIAFDLGFSSSQYFSTTFRKWVGLTPRAFRLQEKQNAVPEH